MTRTRSILTANVRSIPDSAVLKLDELREILGLPKTSLRREARSGRLVVSRRCGCYWTRGDWIREWLAGGVVASKAKRESLGQ